jgi:hypothetical protein
MNIKQCVLILVNDFNKLALFFLLDVFNPPTCDDMWVASIKNDVYIDKDMNSSRDQTFKKRVIR